MFASGARPTPTHVEQYQRLCIGSAALVAGPAKDVAPLGATLVCWGRLPCSGTKPKRWQNFVESGTFGVLRELAGPPGRFGGTPLGGARLTRKALAVKESV